jgi:hypothetical protein
MEKKDANDQIFANQVAGMPLDEAIFQAGYSAGVDFEKGRQTGAVLRETIEDILLKTGKHNQDECSELADMILNDLPKAPTGAVWVKDALQQSKDAIEFADKEFACPQHFVETWGNMYMNALHAIDQAMDERADWISVKDRLPEIGEYVLVYNTEHATLVGRLMSNGWVAMFADGENFMGELTAVYWRRLPAAPRGR